MIRRLKPDKDNAREERKAMRKNGVHSKFILSIAAFISVIACATGEKMVVTPRATIKGADYVGQETCALCHEEIVRDFRHTDHGGIRISGAEEQVEGQGCEACHGPGSLHLEAGGGRAAHTSSIPPRIRKPASSVTWPSRRGSASSTGTL